MGEEQRRQHVVMLPFMAQGHLIPFLALANQIAQRFPFKLTIASTPLNVRYLRTTHSNNSSPPPPPTAQIDFYELPFNSSDHSLPTNTENTEALPLNLVANLFHAAASLEADFRRLITDFRQNAEWMSRTAIE